MQQPMQVAASALITGTVASLVSAAALAALARLERKGASQPVNATSHWLHGDQAATVREADLAHTGVGAATHHASALFWAAPFEAWQHTRPARTTNELVRDAAVM